jgi:hypothetical protein
MTGERSAEFESGNSEYLSIAYADQAGLAFSGSFSVSAWVFLWIKKPGKKAVS